MVTSFGWVFTQPEGHQWRLLLFLHVVGVSHGPQRRTDCLRRELGKRIFGLDGKTEESVCTRMFGTKPPTFFFIITFITF